MKNKYVILILVLISSLVSSQNKESDEILIAKAIQNYFDGYIHRDITKLSQAFDLENGAMKVHVKAKDGVEHVENNYFSVLIPKWAAREKLSDEVLNESALKILNIDMVDGKIATAKINMKVGDAFYIDILSLQKINEEWKIVNKIFVAR